jgi:hypothetical protein
MDFWELVAGRQGLGGLSLRFSAKPTFVDLNDQSYPTTLQTYPLQLEICLRLKECYTIGFLGWQDRKFLVITLGLPPLLIKDFSGWTHDDAKQVADALRAIKAAYLVSETFELPYLARFSFMFRGKSRALIAVVAQEQNKPAVVASKLHSDKFVVELCWRERYYAGIDPEMVLRCAECDDWGRVLQWLSDAAVVDTYLTKGASWDELQSAKNHLKVVRKN